MTTTLIATVTNNVPKLTVIGRFNEPVKLITQSDKANYFVISHDGLQLMSNWTGSIAADHYNITVETASAPATRTSFPVEVVMPPTAAAATVKVNGSSGPVSVAGGSALTATVANGPGNPGDWLGVYAVGAPSGPDDPASWKWLSTDDARSSLPPAPGVGAGTVHLVIPATAGQYEVRFFANNGFNVIAKSAVVTATNVAPPPPPRTLVLSLSPVPAQIDDRAAAGFVLSTATVKYSDGTVPASTTLTSSDPSLVGINGAQVVLARALSAADDGVHHVKITASDGLGVATTTRLFGGGDA